MLEAKLEYSEPPGLQRLTMLYAPIDRRTFLKVGGTAAGGLLITLALPACRSATADVEPFSPSVFLRIDRDGLVTVTITRTEMGQGVMTALPMLIAEELEADWSTIRVERALADEERYGPQVTVASVSINTAWIPLRTAGATAREMLRTAAAETWGVPQPTCVARAGAIVHEPTGRSLEYGRLVGIAAQLPVPEQVALKSLDDFGILGKPVHRLDSPEKVDGSGVYGIDIKVPEMLTATVVHSPVAGGSVLRMNEADALAIEGVYRVISIPAREYVVGVRRLSVRGGVAVIAENYWLARKGVDALRLEWDEGTAAGVNSSDISATFARAVVEPGVVITSRGDLEARLREASEVLEATYEVPYLAHATMEPMNCTAHVTDGACTVWAPTQAQTAAQLLATEITGLPRDTVTVHTTLLGGGFGRRSDVDYIGEAVLLSRAMGTPVQVVWSREEDTRNDYYRPAFLHKLRGGVDADGRILGWEHRLAGGASISRRLFSDFAEGEIDWIAILGAHRIPYEIEDYHAEANVVETGIPTGYFRSIAYSHTVFANECFIDELAHAAGADPLSFRRTHLSSTPRSLHVLELAAERSGWADPLPPGRFRGIALFSEERGDGDEQYRLYIAQVAEVSVSEAGEIRVHRVTCAADIGFVVNPDIVEAQIEGGIVFGLTAALKGEITIERGRVVQSNFHDYPLLRLDETPVVDVHLVKSSELPAGIGEKAVPPIAPAVANAVFRATGRRIRRLPIRSEDLRSAALNVGEVGE